MSLLQGLYLYEIIMMVLGVILSFYALALLKSTPKTGIGCFLVCAIFIGWPSIQSFAYKDGELKVEKAIHKLQEDPTDGQARQIVKDNLPKLERRPAPNAQVATAIARAQFAIGNEAAAEASLNQALKADPQLPEAVALREKIASIRKLDQLTQQVKSNPLNEAAKQELAQQLAQVVNEPIANPDALAKLAQAQATIGNQQAAASAAAKVSKISPNSAAAMELKRTISVAPH
jgi:hypothetical protein